MYYVTNQHRLESDYDAPTQPLDYDASIKDEAPTRYFLSGKDNPVRVPVPLWVKAFWLLVLIGFGSLFYAIIRALLS